MIINCILIARDLDMSFFSKDVHFIYYAILRLDSFASTWKQKQLEKDIKQRRKIRKGRSVMIQNGSFTPSLMTILHTIFSRYNSISGRNLTQIEASRLWYQCGIRLSTLTEIIGDAKTTQNKNCISFKDFHCLLQRIIMDDEIHHPLLDPSGKIDDSSNFRVSFYNSFVNDNAISNFL